jgi:alkylation response protein AidB-like acyl-CoA dehydrogenase
MLGLAEGAWGHAARYAKQRRQFGKVIADFQAVQFTLAEMAMEIEAAKLMVYNAARLKDAGQPYVREAAMAKLFASQVAERVASQCVEVFGGNGFVRDYPAEKLLPRRQGRQNLRRHIEHAAGHNCQAGARALKQLRIPRKSS